MSTRPACSSVRHSETLPSVRRLRSESCLRRRTASTGSPVTRVVFAHSSGSVSVEEKTSFGMAVSASVPGSPDVANVDMSRYVFAPMRIGSSFSGESSSHWRYSGLSIPHQPGQPSAAPYPSREMMKSTVSRRIWGASSCPFLSRRSTLGRCRVPRKGDGGAPAPSASVADAMAQVDDAVAEHARLEQVEVDLLLVAGEEGDAAAQEHGVDAHTVLVDEV